MGRVRGGNGAADHRASGRRTMLEERCSLPAPAFMVGVYGHRKESRLGQISDHDVRPQTAAFRSAPWTSSHRCGQRTSVGDASISSSRPAESPPPRLRLSRCGPTGRFTFNLGPRQGKQEEEEISKTARLYFQSTWVSAQLPQRPSHVPSLKKAWLPPPPNQENLHDKSTCFSLLSLNK